MNEEPFVNLCENILDLENKGALIERVPPHLRATTTKIVYNHAATM